MTGINVFIYLLTPERVCALQLHGNQVMDGDHLHATHNHYTGQVAVLPVL